MTVYNKLYGQNRDTRDTPVEVDTSYSGYVTLTIPSGWTDGSSDLMRQEVVDLVGQLQEWLYITSKGK